MPAPSSRHLSYDFKAYKELTLRELFMITVITTFSTCVFFIVIGLFTGYVASFACIGILLGFIVAIGVLPQPISRLKKGKPHGYLTKKIKCMLMRPSPYLYYIGTWQKSKHIRSRDV